MVTILIVEDEWAIADTLGSILADAGYRVLTAPNGRAALDRLAESRPDLVISDFMMPIMNGAGLLAAIRGDPAWRDIPVVMMSSLPESRLAAEAPGYVAYVGKPFLSTTLIATIERVLGRGP
jgi:CheY-like chemotaxis protein